MNLPRKEEFKHNGKAFEIIISGKGDTFTVVATLDGNQVSPEYSVNIETHRDYFADHKGDLIDHLVELAKSDIKEEMYFKA